MSFSVDYLNAATAIVSLIMGAIGAFLYFRVSLEHRLTALENTLPESRLRDYESRLSDLEGKMAELGFMQEIIREVVTCHVEEVFGRRHS